ncbi:hypothetical protein FFK22_025240 [Mycobacterium sp. KBS0706]|uniref:hypothetical protein n=1 Tax=Mycobacterium sp. KBS0706 TaxID=2578109 RepID=UPI00110FA1BF|nr:hypothetical protein [Mycobacterium sp. KBS0706]TSD85901.1 hypothetical protein FFK22_025240 [Mycobacterium sp. KBS0706]
MNELPESHDPDSSKQNRRDFMSKCGRFAVITPPAMTILLSTSLTSEAIAKSGGKKGGSFAEHTPSTRPGS